MLMVDLYLASKQETCEDFEDIVNSVPTYPLILKIINII